MKLRLSQYLLALNSAFHSSQNKMHSHKPRRLRVGTKRRNIVAKSGENTSSFSCPMQIMEYNSDKTSQYFKAANLIFHFLSHTKKEFLIPKKGKKGKKREKKGTKTILFGSGPQVLFSKAPSITSVQQYISVSPKISPTGDSGTKIKEQSGKAKGK